MIDAGVGDQDVEAAAALCQRGDLALRELDIGDVEGARFAGQPLRRELGRPRGERRRVTRGEFILPQRVLGGPTAGGAP